MAPEHRSPAAAGFLAVAPMLLGVFPFGVIAGIAAVEALNGDEDVRVIVVSGEGRAFSAGFEAPLPEASGDDEVARLIQSFAAMKRDLKSYITDLEAATARRVPEIRTTPS